jgi:hypothetical protein
MDIFIILCTSAFFLVVWFICNFWIFKNKLPSNVSFRDGLNESIQSDLFFLLKKASIGLKFMHIIGKPL